MRAGSGAARSRRAISAALAAAFLPLLAEAAAGATLALPPFKDKLFAYDSLTASTDGGAYLDVPYSEVRDIDRRDEIPERRVERAYVDLSVTREEADDTIPLPGGSAKIRSVGNRAKPTAIVLFVHGRGGDRRLGMNDWTFGGNFNRLKNLLSRAGGLYITVDGGPLGEVDGERVAAIISALKVRYPQTPLVLACGSMGGALCWQIGRNTDAAPQLAGMVLLSASSSRADFDALRKAAGGRAVPLLFGHGSRDKVYALADQRALFEAVRHDLPTYPVRFVAFDGGNHGTPIRMIDWRDALNWILAQP